MIKHHEKQSSEGLRLRLKIHLLALGLLLALGSTSAANLSAAVKEDSQQSAAEENVNQLLQFVSSQQQQQQQKATGTAASDIVIDDESFGKFTGNRLKYESSSSTTQATLIDDVKRAIDPKRQQQSPKPEPRNHDEDQQQDNAIIDHRPSGLSPEAQHESDHQQQTPGTTQTPPTSSTTTSSAIQQQQQQTQPESRHAAPSGSGWGQTQVVAVNTNNQQQQTSAQGYLSAPQQQNMAYGASMIAQPSNQILTAVQHPNSINSIINDQQQQQQQVQVLTQASNVNQQQMNGQVMTALPNGQAPVILVNSAGNGIPRRISLSNWLRGISSMLANIFNRREHALGQPNPMLGQASSSSGHWIQLGPNAPHWLTQAQSAIQQFQQQQQQPAPQFPNNQQLLGSASANRYTFVAASPQQPMAISLQTQPATPNYMANGGDLQASSSSLSHISVMPAPQSTIAQYGALPTSNNVQPGGQAQQQQPQSPASVASKPQIASRVQQQQQTAPTPTTTTVATTVVGPSNGGNRIGRSAAQSAQMPASSVSTQNQLPLAHYSRYSD